MDRSVTLIDNFNFFTVFFSIPCLSSDIKYLYCFDFFVTFMTTPNEIKFGSLKKITFDY